MKPIYPLIIPVLCILLLSGCKQEFFPPEVGEPIPGNTYPALVESLPTGGYETFKAIWERSTVEDIVAQDYAKADLTYLVPDDEALADAGYTLSNIAGKDIEELDSLLLFHILQGKIMVEDLPIGANIAVKSLLQMDKIAMTTRTVSGNEFIDQAYVCRHYLYRKDNALMDNNVALSIKDELAINNGHVLLIDRLVDRPKKQMIDVIREDDRFSLFRQASDLNAAIRLGYVQAFMSTIVDFVDRAVFEYHYSATPDVIPSNVVLNLVPVTLFLPINEAFHEVGIDDSADITALSQRSDLGNVTGNGSGKSPLENVLHLHTIRGASLITGFYNFELPDFPAYFDVRLSSSPTSNPIFFGYNLLDMKFSPLIELQPYVFDQVQDGTVTVQGKGSAYDPANILETIMTLQGPVHIVDKLIIQEGIAL